MHFNEARPDPRFRRVHVRADLATLKDIEVSRPQTFRRDYLRDAISVLISRRRSVRSLLPTPQVLNLTSRRISVHSLRPKFSISCIPLLYIPPISNHQCQSACANGIRVCRED